MFAQGDAVGVAVSGGRDSVCLLDVLLRLAPSWGLRLLVVHINHRLRPEADEEERFVQALAQASGLDCVVDRPEIVSGNLEESARDARLRFFHRLIASGRMRRIATAHTQSDQAETVLFRLLRGAGPAGLRGIQPVTREGLIRPLLEIPRSDVDAWIGARGLAWCEDQSNSDLRFSRNRIRHELLPLLAREWNPRIVETLVRTAEISSAEDEFLEEAAGARWRDIARSEPDGTVVLDFAGKHAPALGRRLVRRAIQHVKGDLRQIEFEHVEAILRMTDSANGHDRVIAPGIDVMRSFHWLRFAPPRSSADENRNWSFPLPVPASIEVPVGRVTVGMERPACDYNEIVTRLERPGAGKSLILRNWRPGDRFQRPGRGSLSKIKELFQEDRIPLWERRNWPVIVSDNQVLWAGEFGTAQGYAAEAPDSGIFVKLTRSVGLYRPSVNRNGEF